MHHKFAQAGCASSSAIRLREMLARAICAHRLARADVIATSACVSNLREQHAPAACASNSYRQLARAKCASSLREQLAQRTCASLVLLYMLRARAACASRFLTFRHLTYFIIYSILLIFGVVNVYRCCHCSCRRIRHGMR